MDYILQFADEPTAQAALPQLFDADGGWRTDICIPGVSVYQVTGTTTDEDGNTSEVREYQAGWFIRVSVETGVPPFDMAGLTAQPVFAS